MDIEKKVIKIGKYSLGIILDKNLLKGKDIKEGDTVILRDIKLKKSEDGKN